MPPMSRITAHHKKNSNKYSARKKADILWNSARNNSLGSKHKVFISPDADDPPVAYVSIDQMYQKFMVGLAAAGSNFFTLDLELILNFFYLLKNDASR